MINSKKLISALEQREDDSKRIDAILNALIHSLTEAIHFKDFTMTYDHEFKVFECVEHKKDCEPEIFKDGREAIDYCLNHDISDSNELNELVSEDSSQEEVVDSIPAKQDNLESENK